MYPAESPDYQPSHRIIIHCKQSSYAHSSIWWKYCQMDIANVLPHDINM
ncbi:MAG: hypothetical protein ACRYFR_14620 [Janthinobacterium lividum]